MSFNCDYCNKFLKSRSSLRKHSKTPPKSCVKIRNNNTCSICNKILLYTECLESHERHCSYIKALPSINEKNIESKYEHKIHRLELEKKRDVEKLQHELDELKQQNMLLENDKEHLQTFKDMYEKLAEKCALKDTTTTNINNSSKNTYNQIVQLLETGGPLDLSKERIDSIFQQKYTAIDFRKGVAGLADFTAKHIICNNEGDPNYAVSDRARHKYKYMDDGGNIINDSNAEHVLNAINGPAIHKIKSDIWNPNDAFVPPEHDNDYSYEIDKYNQMRETYNSIDTMKDNPVPFCSKLSQKI